MFRNRFAILAPAMAALAMAGCANPGQSGAGNTAPSSQLQFSAQTLDGKEFSGESLKGKPAALWFWAPWCPTCQREAPQVEKAVQAHPGVTFIGVAARDKQPAMEGFVKKYGLTFTQINDADSKVWAQFGITNQPAYAFVGQDGTVEVEKRSLSEEDLNKRLDGLARR